MRHRFGHGFTLVELLVVIAIIGVLVALLLPAINAARAAAKRRQCSSHFHQVGVAMHSYHSAHKEFPPADMRLSGTCPPPGGGGFQGVGWGAFLLSHLEERALYDQMDLSGGSNSQQAKTRVNVYRCPSDPQNAELIDFSDASIPQTSRGASPNFELTNMAATIDSIDWSCGAPEMKPYSSSNGALGNGRSAKVGRISDGTSSTVLLAEVVGMGKNTNRGFPWIGFAVIDVLGGINGIATVTGNPSLSAGPGPPYWNRHETGVASWHPGGAHFLFADGSVHFLDESIDFGTTDPSDPGILQMLTTRAGAEVLPAEYEL